uniref:C3H1-type domain-containing protein n=1 Tax=Caenorhabditis tropicalis TaxID=1561998 RepID=A0A1I7TL63_9PELO
MADVYTPTKTMDGLFASSSAESPVVYVPTRIEPVAETDAPSTSTMKEDQTTRQRYGAASDAYSPSNPAIRIVKRKPKPGAAPTSEASTSSQSVATKRRASEEGEDPAILALKTNPKKSILRLPELDTNRVKRRIFFADSRQLPLCHIKEIERIAAIHSNVADFRCSERNEAAHFGHEHAEDDLEEVDWCVMQVKGLRPHRTEMSESGKREEKRVAETGFMRGAMFGSYTLECIEELNEQAATDLANYRPIKIPTESVPSEHKTISALHDLPLPGRFRQQQQPANRPSPVHQSPVQQPPAQQTPATYAQAPAPVIQQVFQEAEPVNNYYTATTDPAPAEPTKSSFDLPANLKDMLAKLKQKGFVKSEESEAVAPAAPVDGFAAAVQTAQQLMSQQNPSGNTYACEEPAQDYPMDGYVATFATPEAQARSHFQDSRNAEGWTQSGWKIHEPCVYFVNRPGGCNRGDQCRFLHDDELRRKTMAELPPRGPYHHDGFRGRGRGGFRGGFRGSQHHHDRDFRDQGPPRMMNNRFGDQDPGFRGGRFNRFNQPHQSRFDQKAEYNQYPSQGTPTYNEPPQGHPDGPSPPKRPRVSRFDQPEDQPGDVDHRMGKPQRRSRFDEGRAHRTRFDQPAADRDDRAVQEFQ